MFIQFLIHCRGCFKLSSNQIILDMLFFLDFPVGLSSGGVPYQIAYHVSCGIFYHILTLPSRELTYPIWSWEDFFSLFRWDIYVKSLAIFPGHCVLTSKISSVPWTRMVMVPWTSRSRLVKLWRSWGFTSQQVPCRPRLCGIAKTYVDDDDDDDDDERHLTGRVFGWLKPPTVHPGIAYISAVCRSINC